jgi:hypothetical protein
LGWLYQVGATKAESSERACALAMPITPLIQQLQSTCSKGALIMQPSHTLLGIAAIAAMIAATPACADTLKSRVACPHGIGQKTASQPSL